MRSPGTRRSILSQAPLDTAGGLPSGPALLVARDGEHFESIEAFAGAVAVQVRSDGLPGLRVIPRLPDGSLDCRNLQVVGRRGELDAVRLEPTPAWDQRTLRYRLDSFATAATILEHDIDTGTSTELLRAELPGYDPAQYVERRLWATSADGTRVPISLFARRDIPADGTAPCLLYGDGAFGRSNDPVLQPESLAIADRGVVIAVAHVRGGGEMGPDWHRQGRGLSKGNSFDDFVACADHLVSTGWAAQERLGAVGTGAGALLVGAAANRAPERFRAVVAGVPLVDPLETLLDADVMLTLEQWAEWGDPASDEANYRCLRSYSPAENIRETEYPAIFAWTALEGADVPAACAAIWIVQLRERVTSDPTQRPVLLRATPTMGSAGDPRVEGVAWLLDQLGAVTLRGMTQEHPAAPFPPTAPTERTFHGDAVVDPYEWMRDKTDPEVIAHLEAENAYADARTTHLDQLRGTLVEEFVGHTQETGDPACGSAGRLVVDHPPTAGNDYPAFTRVADAGVVLPQVEPGVMLEGEQMLLDAQAEAAGLRVLLAGRSRTLPRPRAARLRGGHRGR